MKLVEAQEIVRTVSGRSYWWLKQWGLSLISEAVRTIENRKSATEADKEYAYDIRRKLWRKW